MSGRFFDPAALHAALDAQRLVLGISWRELGRQAECRGDALAGNLRGGGSLRADTFLRLLAWLGETDITPYVHVLRQARDG